ncbi:zinc transport protein ZntB [Maritalea myrionectae]|uniref:Zinc transport protein ZntB n=1 Tax=Maritalea myrionectae TaxID=454601 RepID=A0A2R4MCU4_9HYPH|nr:zinc transporter ZntB [Maritalea myrionectae]AVX03858.1 zinc transport protein ZntB [Maritalea myrionectae]
MKTDQNFAFAYDIFKDGTSKKLDVNATSAADKASSAQGFKWVHVQGNIDQLRSVLNEQDLDPLVVNALSAEETRPRCTPSEKGAILILRGVNLNEGAEPEDMISIRIWVEQNRVISCGIRRLKAIDDVVDMITSGRAPKTSGDLVAVFALRLADRVEPVVAELNEQVDGVEENLADAEMPVVRRHLAEIRRSSIILRRYMFPQRDALTTFELEGFSWISKLTLSHLREAVERVTRVCEELDSIRDRAQIIHDQILDERAEFMNKQMLVLTIVAAFFLPVGFLTGLLGMNVGGVPLMDNPFGFAAVCGFILFVFGIEYLIFKKLKLF